MRFILVMIFFYSGSVTLQAKEKGKTKIDIPAAAESTTTKKGKRDSEPTKVKSDDDGYTAVPSTKIDFSETSIDGKMKAPEGFFLQGRQSQSLVQMVKLRSNFRNELRNSRAAVRSIVK